VLDGPVLSSGPFHNDLLGQLLSLVANSANTSGTPWYVDDHDEDEVIHAKIFGLVDYLGMDAVCDLALARIFKNREVAFHAQSRRDALDLLMPKINQNREKTDYMIIAKACGGFWTASLSSARRRTFWKITRSCSAISRVLHSMMTRTGRASGALMLWRRVWDETHTGSRKDGLTSYITGDTQAFMFLVSFLLSRIHFVAKYTFVACMLM
jgi:hypothetical protein